MRHPHSRLQVIKSPKIGSPGPGLPVSCRKLRKFFRVLFPLRKNQSETDSASVSITRLAQLQKVEKTLRYSFENPGILDRALTHRSYTHEIAKTRDAPSYESLEFLGDAILGFLICEKLFLSNQDLSEGDLSKIRSYLVSTRWLAKLSAALNLGDFLYLSRGEEKTGGRKKTAILADLFESVIAAIFLDGGIDSARRFVLDQFQGDFDKLSRGEIAFRDPKSQLQEKLHQKALPVPSYRVVSESGPDHRKEFVVTVSSEGQVLGSGSEGSKKEAEKLAAQEALRFLRNESESGKIPNNEDNDQIP